MADRSAKEHFNGIAGSYQEELPRHIREYLTDRWWNTVKCYFAGNPKVIDIGCGNGSTVAFLVKREIDAVGVDFSKELINTGRKTSPILKDRIFEGNALDLAYGDGTFDVAFMIGMLHHIHSAQDQTRAVMEALRVVKDDGVLIIRESNPANPLFRIFWNYIFPLTSKIDRFGGERWIPAGYFKRTFMDRIDNVFYFTFIPNFTPGALIPIASKAERALEKSFLKKLSAHYVVVLRKRE